MYCFSSVPCQGQHPYFLAARGEQGPGALGSGGGGGDYVVNYYHVPIAYKAFFSFAHRKRSGDIGLAKASGQLGLRFGDTFADKNIGQIGDGLLAATRHAPGKIRGLVIPPLQGTEKMQRHGNHRVHSFEKRRGNGLPKGSSHVKGKPLFTAVFKFMDNGLDCIVEIKEGINRLEGLGPMILARASPQLAVLAAERTGLAISIIVRKIFNALRA